MGKCKAEKIFIFFSKKVLTKGNMYAIINYVVAAEH